MHPSPTRTRTPYYPNWGMSWCPVLPAVLRRAWHDVPLPWSLRNCFRRTDLTTFGALDASALLPGEILPPLGRESLAEYLGERWEEVDRLVPCSLEEWQSLDFAVLPCSTRSCNAMLNALSLWRMLSRDWVPTVGELRNVRGFGPTMVLDVLCSIELALDPRWIAPVVAEAPGRPEPPLTEELALLEQQLDAIAGEPWGRVGWGGDRRFQDLLPGERETRQRFLLRLQMRAPVGESTVTIIDRNFRELRARVARIATEPLEEQLFGIVASFGRSSSESRARMLQARLGWDGRAELPRLEETAAAIDVTRERARQLTERIKGWVEHRRVYLPGLQPTLDAIRARLPLPATALDDTLRAAGVVKRAWSPEAILRVAEMFGAPVPFAISGASSHRMLVDEETARHYALVASHLHRQVKGLGAARLDQAYEGLPAEVRGEVSAEALSKVLETFTEFRWHRFGWYWTVGSIGTWLRTPLRQMLAVAPQLPIDDAREGLDRAHRFDRRRQEAIQGAVGALAPASVLAAYFAECDELAVDGDAVRWCGGVLDDVHSPTDAAIIELVRHAPSGVIERDALFAAWDRRGLNRATLATKLSYAPYLRRAARAQWGLRGV